MTMYTTFLRHEGPASSSLSSAVEMTLSSMGIAPCVYSTGRDTLSLYLPVLYTHGAMPMLLSVISTADDKLLLAGPSYLKNVVYIVIFNQLKQHFCNRLVR